MTEWMPIESAPVDGTEFLAYDPIAGKYDVCTRRPDGVNIQGKPYLNVDATQVDGEYGPDDDDFQGGRATLWTPLPLKHPLESVSAERERCAAICDNYTLTSNGGDGGYHADAIAARIRAG